MGSGIGGGDRVPPRLPFSGLRFPPSPPRPPRPPLPSPHPLPRARAEAEAGAGRARALFTGVAAPRSRPEPFREEAEAAGPFRGVTGAFFVGTREAGWAGLKPETCGAGVAMAPGGAARPAVGVASRGSVGPGCGLAGGGQAAWRQG